VTSEKRERERERVLIVYRRLQGALSSRDSPRRRRRSSPSRTTRPSSGSR
jgi:hypothetical protein